MLSYSIFILEYTMCRCFGSILLCNGEILWTSLLLRLIFNAFSSLQWNWIHIPHFLIYWFTCLCLVLHLTKTLFSKFWCFWVNSYQIVAFLFCLLYQHTCFLYHSFNVNLRKKWNDLHSFIAWLQFLSFFFSFTSASFCLFKVSLSKLSILNRERAFRCYSCGCVVIDDKI